MKYTTENMQISLTKSLAMFLRSKGYDVFWQATGETDAQTAGLPEAKATVTFVPSFPANPQYIVRLKSDGAGSEEIVVPALSLLVPGDPKRGEILGLGHQEWQWDRDVRIDAFALDEFQQRALADLLYDWLQSKPDTPIPIYDYTTNPATPPALDDAWVAFAVVERFENFSDLDPIRYYIKVTCVLSYVE